MPARVKEQFQKSSLSIGFGRFIGLAEWLAAFGLILPDWTQILPWLTPLAAALLLPIMVGAVVSHQRSKEQPQAIFCIGIIVLLLVVAILGANYFDERDRQQVQRRLVHRLEQLGYSVDLTPTHASDT